MALASVWQDTAPSTTRFEPLRGDAQCDVVVIGAGITGLSCALELAQAGRQVVVLEALRIGDGTTGRSTGNLYDTVSEGLAVLVDRWGLDDTRRVVAARRETVARIEARAAQLAAEVGFRRCPLVLYPSSESGIDSVEQEARAWQQLSLNATRESSLPAGLPPPAGPALLLPQQAQMQPAAYVRGLARAAAGQGVRIFEQSPVLEVDASARRVHTAEGSVSAGEIVHATHSPKGFHLVQAAMIPGQEYGVAFSSEAPILPPGIFWSRGEPQESLRSHEANGRHYLLYVGERQKTGQHDPAASLAVLQAQARKRLGLQQQSAAYRWSAQNFRSADGLPFVGRDAAGSFIATGFATDGLVWGTLAAHLIAEAVLGREHPMADLLKPGRFTLAKGAKGIVEENVAVAKAFVKDYVTDRADAELASLAPGEGRIVSVDREQLAAYRSPEGTLHLVSPVCTHMKCRVHWNPAETSWDCPCHGSRFAPDGSVLEGPAITPLARRQVPQAGAAPGP